MKFVVADRLAQLLLRLYPRAWRDRYGDEFLALIDEHPLRVRTALDLIASGLAERAISMVSLKGRRARALARGCARLGLTMTLNGVAIFTASILAVPLTNLPWRADRGEFAIPGFLLAAQTVWLQLHFSRHRRRGSLATQPPLGPLSANGLATVWTISMAILVMAKWIQWTSTPSPALELAGWPTWASRMLDDPTNVFFSTPLLMAAAATVYDRWPSLRIGAEPPDVPRHPLGLA